MHNRFVAEGKPGATMRSGSNYSTWWNGGLRTTVYFHNMIGLLTEAIGNPTPGDNPARPPESAGPRRPAGPRRAADLALPPVDRLLGHRRPRRARRRVASTGRSSCSTSTGWAGTPSSEAAATTGPFRPRMVEAAQDAFAREREREGPGGPGPRAPGQAPLKYYEMLRDPGQPRPARVRHPFQSAGLPDRHEIRQRADQDRASSCTRRRGLRGRRQELSGGVVRRQNGAGIPAARARHVRAAGPPRRFPVSGRTAQAALRQRGMDSGVSDGRAVRPRPRRL